MSGTFRYCDFFGKARFSPIKIKTFLHNFLGFVLNVDAQITSNCVPSCLAGECDIYHLRLKTYIDRTNAAVIPIRPPINMCIPAFMSEVFVVQYYNYNKMN